MTIFHKAFAHNDILTWNIPLSPIGITPRFNGYAIVTGIENTIFNQYIFARFRVTSVTIRSPVENMLSRFSHIDVVYAQNDPMAAGAYTAALQRGRERDIRFIGTDALPGKDLGVELVLSGKLDATFIYPTGGDKVMIMFQIGRAHV